MLTCRNPNGPTLPDRRSFLRAGTLALGGLTLADLARLTAETPTARKDASVILVWMSGGPGHMETWDPKPNAVAQYRGPSARSARASPASTLENCCPSRRS